MNFEKKYGTIDPNQTWDFTRGKQLLTRSSSGITIQHVPGLDFGIEGQKNVTKNNALYTDIDNILKERERHEGKPAMLLAPSNSFSIYPIIARGQWTHKLYVKVGDEAPVMIYDKHWNDANRTYCNGMVIKGSENNQRTVMDGVTITAPVGTPIEIYAGDITTKGGESMPSAGTTNGYAILVDTSARPEGIELPGNAVVKYVGIEDDTRPQSDHDYNDIVLAIVGNPDVPAEVIITEDQYEATTGYVKRYMVEDLGATDDFDFNDIVIDVMDATIETHNVNKENNAIKSDAVTSTTRKQTAIIRHLGGTLPFQLTIGTTELPEMQGVMGANPNQSYEIEGWDPDLNNITIKVRQLNNAGVFTIQFPKKGEAPMIIAVDPSQEWMSERQSVPASWFTEE